MSGIERATALAFAAAGARVAVVGRRVEAPRSWTSRSTMPAPGPCAVRQVELQAWHAEIDVNLNSVYYCMRHEIPAMGDRGVIINNASVLGLVGVAGMAPYVAAKHAVVGLTRATALEYARSVIRINAIAPAGVDTPHHQAVQGADPATGTAFRNMHPIGRLGTPEEVAGLVLYLASDSAAFFSAAAVTMDGAWSAG